MPSRKGTKVVILLCVTGLAKSKSSDGKPGWVQLGGKYAGKPCARQPGQTTKPKCGSSKMKRNLSKDEEERAFRRKNAKDPNPDRKGKAINVKTEAKDHEVSMAQSQLSSAEKNIKDLKKKIGRERERSASMDAGKNYRYGAQHGCCCRIYEKRGNYPRKRNA